MKAIGALLVVVGLLALVYGGISYSLQRPVLEVGPIEATEPHDIPLSPIAGGIAVVGGLVFLALSRRRAE